MVGESFQNVLLIQIYASSSMTLNHPSSIYRTSTVVVWNPVFVLFVCVCVFSCLNTILSVLGFAVFACVCVAFPAWQLFFHSYVLLYLEVYQKETEPFGPDVDVVVVLDGGVVDVGGRLVVRGIEVPVAVLHRSPAQHWSSPAGIKYVSLLPIIASWWLKSHTCIQLNLDSPNTDSSSMWCSWIHRLARYYVFVGVFSLICLLWGYFYKSESLEVRI